MEEQVNAQKNSLKTQIDYDTCLSEKSISLKNAQDEIFELTERLSDIQRRLEMYPLLIAYMLSRLNIDRDGIRMYFLVLQIQRFSYRP